MSNQQLPVIPSCERVERSDFAWGILRAYSEPIAWYDIDVKASIIAAIARTSAVRDANAWVRTIALLASIGAVDCTYGATEVLVRLDTDAPANRLLTIRVTAHQGSDITGAGESRTWRRGAAPDATLPATFAIVPAEGAPRDGIVTLVVDAELSDAGPSQPPITFRRIARFAFTPRQPTALPIFLALACGAQTTGCVAAPAGACTQAVRCEEQNRTCGELGECVDVTIATVPIDAGTQVGSDARFDATDARRDAFVDAVVTDVPAATITAPRPIAPASTATVTSLRPRMQWALANGSDGARVEVFEDRACTRPVTSFDATGSSGAPSADLPASRALFWRVRARLGATMGGATSPVWEFWTGARSAPINTAHGTIPDLNGDGYADVIIGAIGGTGNVYIYTGAPRGLPTVPSRTLIGYAGVDSGFGISVASAGDVNGDGYGDMIVGARNASRIGVAYVFHGGPGGLPTTAPASTLMGADGAGAEFGFSVASAGDVNRDGYADVIVGSHYAMGHVGRAYLYLGSATGVATTAATSLTGPDTAMGEFGNSVAPAGDVNGDGFADVIIGASHAMSFTGSAHVYFGSMTGLPESPSLSLSAVDGPNGLFGVSVASAGDVDGDGYSDVIVGASGAMSITGRAHVFVGGASGPATTPARSLTGVDGAGGYFGASVAGAGDVNRDGYSDVIVGSQGPLDTNGRARVYLGASAGTETAAATALTGLEPNSLFGYAVSGAGDVNGDGFAEVIVGAFGGSSGGHAFVYPGSAAGVMSGAPTTFTSPPGGAGSVFGISVASRVEPRAPGANPVAPLDPRAPTGA